MKATNNETHSGLFIAGIGVPGAGKSSVFRELSKLLPQATLIDEPEESDWPASVRDSFFVNRFDFMMAARAMWIPGILQSQNFKNQGKIALNDNYYIKFLPDMLGHDDVDYILPTADPYYSIFREITRLDANRFHDPDIYIFLDPDLETWKQFIQKRARKSDINHPEPSQRYNIRKYIIRSLDKYEKQGITVIHIKQEYTSPRNTALKIMDHLAELPNFPLAPPHQDVNVL